MLRLRSPGGVDADFDLFHLGAPAMDWTSSLLNAVNVSDVVLIAVSARYRLSFERPYAARAGKGAADEARVLRAHLREAPNQLHPKAMVVVLPGATVDDIPPDLQMVERYDVSTIDDAGLEGLLRAIHGSPKEDAPATVRTMIGDVQAVPLLPSLEIEVRRRLERALKGTIERAARIAAAERSWRDGLGVLLDEKTSRGSSTSIAAISPRALRATRSSC